MKLNVQENFKCLIWRLASLHKFNCGLRKAKKISMMMLVVVSTATTDENIEAVKKMILNSRRITIRELTDDLGILFAS